MALYREPAQRTFCGCLAAGPRPKDVPRKHRPGPPDGPAIGPAGKPHPQEGSEFGRSVEGTGFSNSIAEARLETIPASHVLRQASDQEPFTLRDYLAMMTDTGESSKEPEPPPTETWVEV